MDKINISNKHYNNSEIIINENNSEYSNNKIQQEMLRRPEKKILELRKNNLKNIINSKDKIRQISDENYNYPHLEIKIEQLKISQDLIDEYNIYDSKLEVIDDLLKKSEIKDQTKFAIYHMKIFSALTFEEGEENFFNSETMFSIFNSLLIILKYTQENDIKYDILIILFNIIKENETFLINLLEKENLDLIYQLTFYNDEGIIYQALSLISGLLTKDELSWKLMKEIKIIKRLGELLSVDNLSIPIRFVCIQNALNLIKNHQEEEDIINEIEENTFEYVYKIYKENKDDVLFENSNFHHIILNYFYRISREWPNDKFKHLLDSDFFNDFLLDYSFNLEKFFMIFNKNDVVHVLLDKNKSIDTYQNYRNVIYNESYEILIKNNFNYLMEEDIAYSFSNNNQISNPLIKKLFNMIELLSMKMKFFTNVFFSFETEESKFLLEKNFELIQKKLKINEQKNDIQINECLIRVDNKSFFDPNSITQNIISSNQKKENNIDLILNHYVNEGNNFINKIRILCEISKDFKSLKVNESIKYMKTNEDQFNVFEFFEALDKQIEITLGDFIYLFNNIAMNVITLNDLIVNSKFIEDLFYIANFNKGKKLIKNILVLLDELYSNSSKQKDYILALNNYMKFKDLLSEVILNYKKFELESLKYSLVFIRELLYHLKHMPSHNSYCELKTYFEINNVCLIIDELTLHTDTNITNYALLIEKENWSVLDIYSCQNNTLMKLEY